MKVYAELRKHFPVQYDESQSIGKRYRRQDEIGTPFCITYDFDSVEDQQVTVSHRDSMEQIRMPIAEVKELYRKTLTVLINNNAIKSMTYVNKLL